jgi:2'-5' RNA ligase
MGEFDESVMVALLPTTSEWCRIELPHLTLVYAGQISDLPPSTHNELAKAAVLLSKVSPVITLDVLGSDIFGEEDLVDVLILRPTEWLIAMRSAVEYWNASEHKEFKPHVTVGPMGSLPDYIPNTITFNRILVSWGTDQMTYPLNEEMIHNGVNKRTHRLQR